MHDYGEECGCGRHGRRLGPPPWMRAAYLGYGPVFAYAGAAGPEGEGGHGGFGPHGGDSPHGGHGPHGHGGHHGGEGCGRGRGFGAGRGRLGLLEPAVLAALAGGKAHGYDLRRTIDEMSGGRLFADPGGIYRVLRRLEEDGLVRSEWAEGDFGPQKRDYELTDDGRAVLADWAEELMGRIAQLQSIADAAAKASGEAAAKASGEAAE